MKQVPQLPGEEALYDWISWCRQGKQLASRAERPVLVLYPRLLGDKAVLDRQWVPPDVTRVEQ